MYNKKWGKLSKTQRNQINSTADFILMRFIARHMISSLPIWARIMVRSLVYGCLLQIFLPHNLIGVVVSLAGGLAFEVTIFSLALWFKIQPDRRKNC